MRLQHLTEVRAEMVRFVSGQALPKVAKPIYGVETSVFVLQTHNITLCVICQYIFLENGYLFFLFYNITYDGTLLIRAENRAGVMHFEYDGRFITKISDDFGRSVHYEYDSQNRPVIFTNADGNTLEFTYDWDNNLLEVQNFNGKVYMRNRFVLGQAIEQYLPDQGNGQYVSFQNIRILQTYFKSNKKRAVLRYIAN
jgi:YD repeat-containing protein